MLKFDLKELRKRTLTFDACINPRIKVASVLELETLLDRLETAEAAIDADVAGVYHRPFSAIFDYRAKYPKETP